VVQGLGVRILVLTSADRALDNRKLWLSLQGFFDVDIRYLDKLEQRNLKGFFATIDLGGYQRIVLDLMFKHIHTQVRFLRTLPALTMYEEDAYLNFMPGSRWLGDFLRLYRHLPGIRVVSTGGMVTRRLREAGVDVHFVPKGFDPERLQDQGRRERDLELGFVGRLGSKAYSARRAMLEALAEIEPLHILRTNSADEYVDVLNRIRCFVSADVGLGEYMAKNFEAMACGCLLIAKRQGAGEEEALGFVDKVNVLLYDDLQTLCQQVLWVRAHPLEATAVAKAGREFVLKHHGYSQLAAEVAKVVAIPFSSSPSHPWWRWW